MRSNFDDVGDFHEKFGLSNTTHAKPAPQVLDDTWFDFREDFMEEELNEFRKARQAGDLPKMADALIDLVYVAMGTAHGLGLPWQHLWDEVQAANTQKTRTRNVGDSKRGSAYDVIKPEGWQPPDIAGVLKSYGFDV